MNVLIVVAHPDDEVLGCGATGAALADAGHNVRTCFLSGHAEAREGRPVGDQLFADTERAQAELGFGAPFYGAFPNIQMNCVPHIEIVQFIEKAIEKTSAEVIFTHHPADLNDDHVCTSRGCQAAARLAQRRPGTTRLRRLFYMEILSSTDWAFAGAGRRFDPDTFIEVADGIERKLRALRCYRDVIRAYPHARSEESVRALATLRGAQAGLNYAEAFVTAFAAGSCESIIGA